MTDKTEYEIQRGERAAQILAEPIVADALDTIEREYIEKWKSSPVRDEEGREKLWLMVMTLHRFRSELALVIDTGQVAKATLAQKAGQLLSRYS